MPPRSKVGALPTEVKTWLDEALVQSQFGAYEALSAALAERGYSIGKSSLHRYGEQLERRLAAIKASTEAARAIAAAAPDEADERSNAIISLIQTETFEALLSMQEAAEEEDPADRVAILGKAAKNIATLTRASVARNKWAAEVRANTLKEAAARVDETARAQGMTAEQVEFWRKRVLGVT